jgi:hypothetical protein
MTTRSTRKSRKTTVYQNRNAFIRTREDRTGKLRTETSRRDADSISAAVSTDPKSDSTALFIDFPNGNAPVRLDGRQARTLYRLLQKHYRSTDKSW